MRQFPKLKNLFVLAPMAGVTDDAFRCLCAEQGAALVYSEMASAKALHYGDRKSLDLLARAPGSAPVAYQLFGSDPAVMAEAVRKLDALEREEGRSRLENPAGEGGATSEDSPAFGPGRTGAEARDIPAGTRKIISCVFYDVNMGCPVSKVVRNGEGSALMKDAGKAARIVEAMVAATDKPVTIKMRSGWDAATAGRAEEFAEAMERAGAAAVAVHGRTREQYYGGKADWETIARVKDAVNVPVIGSGDVMSAADARRMLRETGCDYVMIARGALGNPWIFRELRSSSGRGDGDGGDNNGDGSGVVSCDGGEDRGSDAPGRPGAAERAGMFIRHARMLEADKGEYIAVREMRKHAGWYFKGLPGVAALRAKVNRTTSIAGLINLVTEYK